MADTKRVLVVDDSATTVAQLRRIIEALDGFEVVGRANNGAEALKQFQELKPDVVCMDIVMPVMGGVQALRGILSADPEAKVVMISSMGDVGDTALEALNAGAKEVLSKPFDEQRVHTVLRAL